MRDMNCDAYYELIRFTVSYMKSIEICQMVSWCETKNIAERVFDIIASNDKASLIQIIHSERPEEEQFSRHCINVSMMNAFLGIELQLTHEELELLIVAGLLHDIGKMVSSESSDVLEYNPKEQEGMKKHPLLGSELLNQEDDFDVRIRMIIKQHHERIDGSGYPRKLKGEEISFFAKITGITDVYDNMVAERSKEQKNPFACLAHFGREENLGLDNALVATFIRQIAASFKNRRVFLSDKTIGTIMLILPNDLLHPIVHVHGIVKQTSEQCYCVQLMLEEENQTKEVV